MSRSVIFVFTSVNFSTVLFLFHHSISFFVPFIVHAYSPRPIVYNQALLILRTHCNNNNNVVVKYKILLKFETIYIVMP